MNFALITAAGRSRRMGGANKMLLEWRGSPILVHCVRRFQEHSRIDGIALSAPPEQVETYRQMMQQHGLDKVRWVVAGGSERQHSIRHALEVLAQHADTKARVLIHDGARPLVSAALLTRLLDSLTADGVLPMVAVKDTIKRVDGDLVLETLQRSELRAAQTPQVFNLGTILRAHRAAHEQDYLGTDDASLIEWQGGRVHLVEGEPTNLKITTPDDLHWMDTLATLVSRSEAAL